MEVKDAKHNPDSLVAAPVYCKDCLHFTFNKGKFPDCAAPQVGALDPVFGEPTVRCQEARETGGACGATGIFFIANDGGNSNGTEPTSYTKAEREPYSRRANPFSASSRSSLTMMNLASAESSPITAATASAETPSPKSEEQIERAVTIRA